MEEKATEGIALKKTWNQVSLDSECLDFRDAADTIPA
jgi:hypothetical protein